MNAADLANRPVFPVSLGGPDGHQDSASTWMFPGVTLRQHYAGIALPAVMAAYIEANGRCIGTDHVAYNCAAHAVRMADALIAELAKPVKP